MKLLRGRDRRLEGLSRRGLAGVAGRRTLLKIQQKCTVHWTKSFDPELAKNHPPHPSANNIGHASSVYSTDITRARARGFRDLDLL